MAYYYGSGSWFCCGHAGSWSSRCSDTGHGSCGNCESYLDHAAWPKLKRPGYPDCNKSDSCLSLPWKYCGNTLVVFNRCNSLQVTVEVHTCGPNTNNYCNWPCGCGYPNCPAIVDLTPNAFSKIANLDAGRIPVRVTA